MYCCCMVSGLEPSLQTLCNFFVRACPCDGKQTGEGLTLHQSPPLNRQTKQMTSTLGWPSGQQVCLC